MKPSLSLSIMILYKDFTAFCDKKLKETGLTRGLLYFLLYIGKHPQCAPAALSKDLHYDFGHTQRCLAKLEEGGFLRREKNPRDKRASLLALSPKGEQVFVMSHTLFTDWDAEALAGLSPQERAQLTESLGRILAAKGGEHDVRNFVQPD